MLRVKQAQQTLRTYLYILTALRTPFGRLKMSVCETPIAQNVKKIDMGSEERHKQGFIHNRHFDLLSTRGKNSSVPSSQELDTKTSSLFITLSIQLLPQASGLHF